LTQRRGAKLWGGSKCGIALTAIETEAVFARAEYARIAASATYALGAVKARSEWARVGSGGRRSEQTPRRRAFRRPQDSSGGAVFLDADRLAAAVEATVAIAGRLLVHCARKVRSRAE
jgi:hypothetical protein